MLIGKISSCCRKLLQHTISVIKVPPHNTRLLSVTPICTLRYFAKNHTWVDAIRGLGYVGITDYGQKCLGEITFLDLPTSGSPIRPDQLTCNIECAKSTVPFYSPVNGLVATSNILLERRPDIINEDCYGRGWIVTVFLIYPDEVYDLMVEEQYIEYIKSLPPPETPEYDDAL